MIRCIVNCRHYLTPMLAIGIGVELNRHFPIPDDNAILLFVAAETPSIFIAIKLASMFSPSFIYSSFVSTNPSRLRRCHHSRRQICKAAPVVGELHHSKRPEP